jgi:histidyl-tRNA synthetase
VATIKDLKVGAEAARSISGNDEWRAARPGQFEVPRSEMTVRLLEIAGGRP